MGCTAADLFATWYNACDESYFAPKLTYHFLESLRGIVAIMWRQAQPEPGEVTRMNEAFSIRFDSQRVARVAQINESTSPEHVASLLGLKRYNAAVSIHAGASGATSDIIEALRTLFNLELAPMASKYQIAVLDGGTDAGVIGMMGEARRISKGTFPLIGVTPAEHALYPGGPKRGERSALEPNHTHFALVSGGSWGIESRVLVSLGRALAFRRVALLINGGEIVRREALMHARAGNDLLVLSGSGRVADEIVDGLKRGTSNNILQETLALGRIQVCTPETITSHLMALLHVADGL